MPSNLGPQLQSVSSAAACVGTPQAPAALAELYQTHLQEQLLACRASQVAWLGDPFG